MKKIIQILILFIVFPLIANAEGEKVLIKCPDNMEANREYTCEITGYSSYEVSGIDLSISLADGVELNRFIVNDSWNGEEYNKHIVLYTGENKIKDFPIGELSLKSSSSLKSDAVKIEKLVFFNKDFEEQVIIEKNVKESKSEEIKTTLNSSSKIKYGIILVVIIMIITFVMIKNKKKIYRFIRKEL